MKQQNIEVLTVFSSRARGGVEPRLFDPDEQLSDVAYRDHKAQ